MPPIRKPDHLKSLEITLPVMEHFYTIQGEGINAGIPAYLYDSQVVMLDVFGAMLRTPGMNQFTH